MRLLAGKSDTADLSHRAADAAVDALDRKALPPHVVLEQVQDLGMEEVSREKARL